MHAHQKYARILLFYIVILGKYALILSSDRVVLMCTESCARILTTNRQVVMLTKYALILSLYIVIRKKCARILSADRMVLQVNMCIKSCALILFANIKGTRGQTGMREFLQ